MFLILLLNCVNTITTTTVDRSSPVTKFVLLARQRGGSHYTVSLIDQDPSCVVTGELVSVEDAVSNNFTASSKWTQKIEEYYERTVPVGGVGAVGFILHHNQVCPTQDGFIECMVEFGSWVAARKIRVLHLVREAALMMVSSDYVQSLDVDHVSSTTNQTRASESHAFASRHLMPLTKESLRRVKIVECEFAEAHRILQRQDYHYLRYESLIDSRLRQTALEITFQFLYSGTPAAAQQLVLKTAFDNSRLLELHPPTCEARIQDWNFSKGLLSQRTRQACERLGHI